MARQAKARFDAKGIAGLGLEKLVEILLEEAAANKALKARLQAALAGATGAEEVGRMIDKRLVAMEQAKTGIHTARARDLAIELSGLLRNIQSELGATDAFGAVERLARVIALRTSIERRLRTNSAKLMKVFEDAQTALAEIVKTLSESDQVKAVPLLDRLRKRDRYGEHTLLFSQLLCAIAAPAADVWKVSLEADLSKSEIGPTASRLLQALYFHRGDVDAYVALENAKPDNRQDSYAVARMLFESGNHEDALLWVRRKPTGMRIVYFDGIAAGVGPEYQQRERKLLEAEILDAMKRRDDAQAIRWAEFLETFDAEILRRYIARLDDFAEFDELDKAFAAVRSSGHIYQALLFLVEWPKLDQAAAHVMAHADEWNGREYEVLVPAAAALSDDHPLAATVLFRVLITHILDRGISNAYEHAAHYLRILAQMSLRLAEDSPIEDHAAFVSRLMNKHARKYGFWQRVPD